MLVLTVLMAVAGLAVMIWVANWPFNTPWEKDLSPEERRINAAHNRRHHRAAARLLSPMLAIVFGLTSVSIVSGPKSDPIAAGTMCLCSVLCVGVFAALIRAGRRRHKSTRR
ncbi:hypothetical protein AB0H28_12525 [Micromonospora sp. NPDC050980]|uniref:hypothetical protein n=1 Tax=Micromonospora sp. NPDC050980 TaxID=3155161 RepID=UPI0034118282